MKRFLPLLLLTLLLCGCSSKEANPTTVSTTAPTEHVAVDTHTSGSQVETLTEGAVRQYDLKSPVSWILPIEDGVLTANAEEKTVLTLLTGEKGTASAEITISAKLTQNNCQTFPGGVIYYDTTAKQVVFLDMGLQETKRLQLPADISGEPAIAQTGKEIYYCVGQTVFAMDTANKTVRPVRTNTCKEQTVLDCYLNGTVVACCVLDMADQWHTLYISGEDGRLLYKDNSVKMVYSSGDTYFALRADGSVDQYIYGKTTNPAMPVQMNIADHSAFGALEQGGIIGQTVADGSAVLSFYNMKKTAAVTLPQDYMITQVAADGSVVWLLTEKGILLRWELESTPFTDDTDYFGTVYTAENPDAKGLEECAKRGDEIGKKHGVVVRVWERALVSNDDYDIEVEYQPAAINKTLDELEKVLELFPEKFLYKSVSGAIRICIVRSIGGEQVGGYHWHDGDPFIILSAGADVEKCFMRDFAYILDIHVLGNSSLADNWTSLNPEGFTYGGETTQMAYLEGDTRAFADRASMISVTEDRATTFYYAIQEGNEEMFKSETMQKKLLMLCKAIRDAWNWEEKTEVFLWEQYLSEPIAYKQ